MILENFEQLNMGQRQLFADTCAKLLATGYLARDKKDNKEQYYFILSFKNYFDEYFGLINYEIIIDREYGSVQLTHKDNKNLLKLKKEESLILLIIRILYHQHLIKTSVNDNVVISISDIHEKYDQLELKRKINKTDLVSILRMYKKFNIIEPLGDITQSNTKVVIYPTILSAIDTHQINDVYQLVNNIVGNEREEEQ